MREHQRFDDEAATWDDAAGHEGRQVAVAHAIEEAVALSPRMNALEVGGGTGSATIGTCGASVSSTNNTSVGAALIDIYEGAVELTTHVAERVTGKS